MNRHSDAVDAVLAAFSDHLAIGTARPMLDHLDPHDRQVAADLMRLMETGRRIDPSASAPSLEALLADTEFADALPAAAPKLAPPVLHQLRDVLTEVDPRAEVVAEPEGFVSFAYLDLLARFHLVDGDEPTLADHTVKALFDADVDVDLIGLVATETPELLTRVLSRYVVDTTVSTAANQPVASPPALPAVLAARRIMEHSAPEWGGFGLDGGSVDNFVDVVSLAAHLATKLVAEEAKRRYQGDKALAYRSLVGHEHHLSELVATAVLPREVPFDLAAEVDRIAREVA
jgi:hypothetical protein